MWCFQDKFSPIYTPKNFLTFLLFSGLEWYCVKIFTNCALSAKSMKLLTNPLWYIWHYFEVEANWDCPLFVWDKHCAKSVQIQSFFWSVFSRIRTEYRDLRSKSPYSVRVRENTDQEKLRIWTLFTQWYGSLNTITFLLYRNA